MPIGLATAGLIGAGISAAGTIGANIGNIFANKAEAERQRLAILKKNQKLEIAAKSLKTVKFLLLGFILCACLLYVLLFFFLKWI